ncbi:MAG TPA: antibiotic ABC transporter permease [Chloroflexi bacterium]|jgi:ABC-2 type transport system permease protein|nr:antibiotic ABC transporter permease [Chloroflexota bacterium]
MSPSVTWATTRRILVQLRHDPRTLALMLVVPVLLMVLLRYVFNSVSAFDQEAPKLLGLFPFLVMFVVTAITMLRERRTETLERLMTMPMSKIDLLAGYSVAFGMVALLQVILVALVSLTVLGLTVAGSVPMLLLIACVDALLGMALGLCLSAFARTEFQAVQFLPAIVLPQALVCGLFAPRNQMAVALQWLSDVVPLTYAVDGLIRVCASNGLNSTVLMDLAVVAGWTVVAIALGAATLRRQTA